MWGLILLVGLILFIVGIVKRKTSWGKVIAVLGAVGVAASLLVAGPEMLDSFLEGYREARRD